MLASGERIRLAGIDAPELRAAGGARAKAALLKMVSGKLLFIVREGRDRLGRSLARLYLPGGRDVSRALLEGGYARKYP